MASHSYAGKVKAPEFPPDAQWLNTPRPLTLQELRGKVVLLDFWTYCCINCMHIIPHLRRLEREFPEELAVVGVHSAKFDQERATENIRQAVMRYGVSHPVLNDARMRVWQEYGVHAWPTLMFIDPLGKVIGRLEGELTYEHGMELIGGMVREFRAAGTLKPFPMHTTLETAPASLLSFPGKVLADASSRRLFISDSGHHRILIADLEGRIAQVIGSGDQGLADGTLDGAQFNAPQGMDLVENTLYVADTENHAIRRVHLSAGVVETVAGTGRQGTGQRDGGRATGMDLRSPWDVAHVDGTLYVAMAGTHQLWALDLAGDRIAPWAGSGREDIVDGPLASAALAQPSGIVHEGGVLYFADSETSSIRSAEVAPDGKVSTLVGRGLFEFGDRDGTGPEVRLQHPLGLDARDGTVYVADTYNHKLKRIAAASKGAATLAGTGSPGLKDGPAREAQFYEPGGVSLLDGRLYVADTNNHAIRALDLNAGVVSTLPVDF